MQILRSVTLTTSHKLTMRCTRRPPTDSCSHKLVPIFVNTPALTGGFVTLFWNVTSIRSTTWCEHCSCFAIYLPAMSSQKVHLTTCKISCKETWFIITIERKEMVENPQQRGMFSINQAGKSYDLGIIGIFIYTLTASTISFRFLEIILCQNDSLP